MTDQAPVTSEPLTEEGIARNLSMDIDMMVAKHGVMIIGSVTEEGFPFAYTIGMAHQELPDLICGGLNPKLAVALLNNAVLQLPGIEPFVGAIRLEKVIKDGEVGLLGIDDDLDLIVEGGVMNQAWAHYQRAQVEPLGALMMVIPSKSGKLPVIDADCEPEWVVGQMGFLPTPGGEELAAAENAAEAAVS